MTPAPLSDKHTEIVRLTQLVSKVTSQQPSLRSGCIDNVDHRVAEWSVSTSEAVSIVDISSSSDSESSPRFLANSPLMECLYSGDFLVHLIPSESELHIQIRATTLTLFALTDKDLAQQIGETVVR